MQYSLDNEVATEAFGGALFHALPEKCLVFLHGDLGAGKTTLVRGFLRAAGYQGTVKSPTYNIVEEYKINKRLFLHFDLYRLVDPEELEWIGIRDYLQERSICFIEWPEQGEGYLDVPDVVLSLTNSGGGRDISIDKLPDGVQINFG
ncbi:MAG: tRNA (adenosine(37)-N6)-threonylcarbamoyltransferase complex ATPase subunit type 1 TsaE [Methyloprofundus sp.]|nr:tRNA (adenosine(37)-N6)-threonylcarbamoyltransferase complex ATPase subunit type 1 TsaE [Methyloprofundus sp.]